MSLGKNQHHSIDYVEFQVKNMEESQSFYKNVFSWDFTNYSSQYAGIKIGENEVGGFFETDSPLLGGMLIVLYTKDLKASEEAVVRAGGVISKSVFSFPGGKRFHFKDPSGHELAVWSKD